MSPPNYNELYGCLKPQKYDRWVPTIQLPAAVIKSNERLNFDNIPILSILGLEMCNIPIYTGETSRILFGDMPYPIMITQDKHLLISIRGRCIFRVPELGNTPIYNIRGTIKFSLSEIENGRIKGIACTRYVIEQAIKYYYEKRSGYGNPVHECPIKNDMYQIKWIKNLLSDEDPLFEVTNELGNFMPK
jgi:hypothetical protein